MDGSKLQNLIKDRIDGIIESFVFCCDKKYEGFIRKKIKQMPMYVYDNNISQIKRLKEVDLLEIALEFAVDVSEGLSLQEDEQFELNLKIAKLIIDIDNETYVDNKIKQILSTLPEIKDNTNKYLALVKKAVNYYQKDSEVKSIKKMLENNKSKNKEFEDKLTQLKRNILDKHFNLTENVGFLTKAKADSLWLFFSTAFNPEVKEITVQSEEFAQNIDEIKFDFYTSLGCEGKDIKELEKFAKSNGKYIDEIKFKQVMDEYLKEFNVLLSQYFYAHSNLGKIEADLEEQGFDVNKQFVVDYLLENKSLLGANFMCLKNDKLTSFVLFINELNAYSEHFIETVIHETIHYLGGKNIELSKCGFSYNDEEKYLCLEESWVYFLTKKISQCYREKNKEFLPILTTKKVVPTYSETFEYMEKVFDKYGDKLFKIYFDEDITLEEAKSIMPFDKISESLLNIVECKDSVRKSVISNEIKKLVKGDKR